MTAAPAYQDIMTAVDQLMLAHTAEIRGGATDELRAVTEAARAKVATMVYAATERPVRPPEPADDPELPIRRGRS